MDFGSNEWGVDRVAGRAAIENRQHLLGGLYRDLTLGFLGGGAQMRGRHDLRVA